MTFNVLFKVLLFVSTKRGKSWSKHYKVMICTILSKNALSDTYEKEDFIA